MRPGRPFDPIGQIVGVGVAGIEEAAGLHHELHGVDRCPPGVPAERALPGHLGVDADRVRDLDPLLRFGHVLVLDPLQAVAGDVPAGFLHRGDNFRISFQGCRHAEYRRRQLALGEYPPQSPEARARAVLEHRFDIGVALSGPGLRTQHVRQECLRGAVTVQNVVFAAFLEIQHELHGDARIAGPAWIGRIAAIAMEIPGISGLSHLHFLEADFLRALPEHGLAERRQILKT